MHSSVRKPSSRACAARVSADRLGRRPPQHNAGLRGEGSPRARVWQSHQSMPNVCEALVLERKSLVHRPGALQIPKDFQKSTINKNLVRQSVGFGSPPLAGCRATRNTHRTATAKPSSEGLGTHLAKSHRKCTQLQRPGLWCACPRLRPGPQGVANGEACLRPSGAVRTQACSKSSFSLQICKNETKTKTNSSFVRKNTIRGAWVA